MKNENKDIIENNEKSTSQKKSSAKRQKCKEKKINKNIVFYSWRNRHALPLQPTGSRHPYGTWKIPLSAALFPT